MDNARAIQPAAAFMETSKVEKGKNNFFKKIVVEECGRHAVVARVVEKMGDESDERVNILIENVIKFWIGPY